jgi:hypothetical protein
MQVLDHRFGTGRLDMRLDLGGAKIRMAEQFLDDAQIGTIGEYVRGEGLPQLMQRDPVGGRRLPAPLP